MVFAEPSGEFYRYMTNPFSISGHTHLDSFIVTRKSCPLTGTMQKHMPTLILTATNQTAGPLGVSVFGAPPACIRLRIYLDNLISCVLYNSCTSNPIL
jgi:hypothetical protein